MSNHALYGPETLKALESFGRAQTPRELVRAYGETKKACLLAQIELGGVYPADFTPSLLEAADEIIRGELDAHFVLPLFQGGAGTSLHMNLNEVLTNRANEKYAAAGGGSFRADPFEHINRYQSTNDTFPTALTIAAHRGLGLVEEKVVALQRTLSEREKKHENLVIVGRTEMQDALPMTLGQVFGAWAGSIERDRWRLSRVKERVRSVALGGTAVGTGFFAPRDYVFAAERHLRAVTGLPLSRSQNLPDEIAHQDKFAELGSAYALLAVNLEKMTEDLLLYTSSFVGELKHPALQYGSTIMAVKTNPVILEYAKGLAIHVRHEAAKIQEYAAAGRLQLNAMLPFIAGCLIEAQDACVKALDALLLRFFPGLETDEERIDRNLFQSAAILNALRPVVGYHRLKELGEELRRRRPATKEEFIMAVAEISGVPRDKLDEASDFIRFASFGGNG